MPKNFKKTQAKEVQEKTTDQGVETIIVDPPKAEEKPDPQTVEVTLKQNGYIREKFYFAGDTVQVSPELKAKLVKTSPEVYQ